MNMHISPKDLVTTMWAEGATYTAIADALTARQGKPVTRNAIAGMVHRMALPKRGPKEPKTRGPRPVTPQRRNPILPPSRGREDFIIPAGQRCGILALTSKTCRWPVGDPRTPGFFFCGGEAEENCPYCRHHAEIARAAS
jgi:GcrA cell cycle regulator